VSKSKPDLDTLWYIQNYSRHNYDYIKTDDKVYELVYLQHRISNKWLGICYNINEIQIPKQNQKQNGCCYQYKNRIQYETKYQYEYHKSPSSNHTEGNYINYVT
jgi:hypothetical protein